LSGIVYFSPRDVTDPVEKSPLGNVASLIAINYRKGKPSAKSVWLQTLNAIWVKPPERTISG